MDYYKVVRFYMRGHKRTLKIGLTLDEAQAHCRNPENSYKTCTRYDQRERTRKRGPWFDGYQKD